MWLPRSWQSGARRRDARRWESLPQAPPSLGRAAAQVTAVLDWLAVDVTRAKAVAGLLRRCAHLLAADVAGQLQPVRDFLLFAGLDSHQARLIPTLYPTLYVMLARVYCLRPHGRISAQTEVECVVAPAPGPGLGQGWGAARSAPQKRGR